MSKRLSLDWLAFVCAGGLVLGACVSSGDDAGDPDDADETGQAGAPAGDTSGDGLAGALAPGAGDVTVDLVAGQPSVAAADSVIVMVTMSNHAAYPVALLAWLAPDGELEEDVFAVRRDGQLVDFTGPHYKRPAATDSDHFVIPPGKSVTRKIDITNVYDFGQTGTYSLQYKLVLGQAGSPDEVRIESAPVSLWIEGRVNKELLASQAAPDFTVDSLSFSRCSGTQADTVTQAVAAATTMTNGASSYLAGSPSATQRYVTWFGSYSSSGWNTAKSHFAAIKDAFDTKPIVVDCGCKKKYYAYVYPTQPYKIYVCSVFWSAPLSGTDSKGGTLIHEASHFNVVAGTDDWAYGQSACQSLASSNPSNALDNADSHEYFAENTPALP